MRVLYQAEDRAAIGQNFPSIYILPYSFTHLDRLPLTSSGKVNPKALPEVDLSQIVATSEYIDPVGETEKQLAALMERAIGYSLIGREDDFFDLGGDRLIAIEFVSMVHNEGTYFALLRRKAFNRFSFELQGFRLK